MLAIKSHCVCPDLPVAHINQMLISIETVKDNSAFSDGGLSKHLNSCVKH